MKLLNILNFTVMLLLSSIISAKTSSYNELNSSTGIATIPNPNQDLLPDKYPVYTKGGLVINHSQPGFKKKILPVDNAYKKSPGCYVSCYSRDSNGIYKVGPGIFVQGMIRVAGQYDHSRICQPLGFKDKDISKIGEFKELCNQRISMCAKSTTGGCWAGGDTGGWYGMQKF